VILFGSRSRGDYQRASDIDLAVSGGDITGFALDVDEETSTPLKYEGSKTAVTGLPRGIIKEAYGIYPFFDGAVWLSMLRDRNDMSHIYDGNAAKELVDRILETYIPQFAKLERELVSLYGTMLKKS
jgi:predicted nucleotidyltransferase